MDATNLIYEMLTESTGTHFLDSGGAYGRHWQRNQKKTLEDFQNEPEVKWAGGYYIISVFHYLNNHLELDSICNEFNKIPCDNWDSDLAYGLSTEGAEYLESLDADIKDAFNTYNYESALSQVLQGSNVEINGESYILIQIHQGCDVRGGYTDAKLFKFASYEPYLSEDVYGLVTKENGEQIQVDNLYNGYSLTDENGNEVEINENDKVELDLMEC